MKQFDDTSTAKPKLSPVQEWIQAREQENEESEPVRSEREDCPNHHLCDTAKAMIQGILKDRGLASWEARNCVDDIETLYDWYRVRSAMPSEAKLVDNANPVETEPDELELQLMKLFAAM